MYLAPSVSPPGHSAMLGSPTPGHGPTPAPVPRGHVPAGTQPSLGFPPQDVSPRQPTRVPPPPTLSSPAGPAAHAGAPQRRLPRAGWQDGRVVSEITHPSRLVGQSSGGEVQKHQLDTRVRNEPRGGGGGPVSEPHPPSALFQAGAGGPPGTRVAPAVSGPAVAPAALTVGHSHTQPRAARWLCHHCLPPGR